MSLANELEEAYSAGLTHPNELFPSARRAALILEKNPATDGVEQDVPYKP